jgi:hypothetical protein
MSPFAPLGTEARWRVIYELLEPLQPGTILTYDRMGEALNLDPHDDRHTIQMAMRRAAKEFEIIHKHAVDSEPNVGYRIVEAPEHLTLAKAHKRKAGRALVRGHSKVVNVDLTGVEPQTRNAIQALAQVLSLQMEFNYRSEMRHRKSEEATAAITDRQERDHDELAELKARLARIEELIQRG